MSTLLDTYAMLEAIPDGIYLTTSDGTTLFVNSAYERITGIKREKVIGRNVVELEYEGLFSPVTNPSVIKTGQPTTVMQTNKLGQQVVVTGYPIRDTATQNLIGAITIVRDLSQLEKLKQEVEYQRALIQQYREAAIQGSKVKTEMVAESDKMRKVLNIALRFATVDTPVLITGETGSGKELIAKILHSQGPRKDRPFLSINCSAIPDALLESELFGYAPGAFTGANIKGKAGLFELSDQGTLFFDEIGELPQSMQPKLLRVLQNQEIMRVGASKTVQVDVRIVAATHRNLDQMVREGRFRQDLLYRLRVASIEVPPLRARPEDIERLTELFLERNNKKYNRELRLAPAVLDVFRRYQWPGNVRELQSVIEVLVVSFQADLVESSDLPGFLSRGGYEDVAEKYLDGQGNDNNLTLQHLMDGVEAKLISHAMNQHGYDVHEVAKVLGCDRTTIQRKVKKYKIRRSAE